MRETTWTIRGRPFGALEWGEPSGVPVVFLHGYLDHAGAWAGVAPLVRGWRIAYDHRGHGRSPHVTPSDADPFVTYQFAEYLADLDDLLGQLGPVVLVGHSMGGTIASMYAGVRPERVLGLVTVDGLGLPDSSERAVERMLEFLDETAALPVNKVFASAADAAARLRRTHPALSPEVADALVARGVREVEGGVTWSWDARHRIRGPIPYRHANHVQFLRRVRCPVLCVFPERSPFAASDVAELVGAMPHRQELTVPDAGHMVHLDAPERLGTAVAEFVAALVR